MSDNEEERYENRRQFRRCKVNLQIGIFQSGKFMFLTAVQISQGGMLLCGPQEFRVGTCIEMCFLIPGASFAMAVAEVAYRLPPVEGKCYIGVRFLQPSAFTQQLIARYIATQPES